MRQATLKTIDLGGQIFDYRLIRSKSARKLRVRVGFDGIEAVQSIGKNLRDVETFLNSCQGWIIKQLERIENLHPVRRYHAPNNKEILFHGVVTPVRVDVLASRKGTNKVYFDNGMLTVVRGQKSMTSPASSLEYWLRKCARQTIQDCLDDLSKTHRKYPRRVYVMDQKTKWGNCSSLQNLSFSWRLIMAPDFVLRYIVTHEFVHLDVPDHSKRFWLTVQSLCSDMDKAKQWLRENGDRMRIDVGNVF